MRQRDTKAHPRYAMAESKGIKRHIKNDTVRQQHANTDNVQNAASTAHLNRVEGLGVGGRDNKLH